MQKICEVCKKVPATVHLTDIKNHQKTELHLCESCAANQGFNLKKPLSLAQLFGEKLTASKQKIAVKERREENLQCPHCGITWEKYREGGRLGCPHDYQVFAKNLKPLLNDLHATPDTHVGKRPRPAADHDALRLRQEYQRKLREAIAKEDYREAARLRDSLQSL